MGRKQGSHLILRYGLSRMPLIERGMKRLRDGDKRRLRR